MPSQRPASDLQLRRAYLSYNRRFFANRLPEDTVLWFEPVAGGLAECECDWGNVTRAEGHWTIRIEPSARYSKRRWRPDLLHELVHIDLWVANPHRPYTGHGRPFERRVRELVNAGAFAGLL